MRTLIAAMLAVLIASTALAGSNDFMGKIVVDHEWITMANEIPEPNIPNAIVRVKTASELGKRFLRECPDGSKCWITLSLGRSKDSRVDGRFITIIKWPEGGVQRDDQ